MRWELVVRGSPACKGSWQPIGIGRPTMAGGVRCYPLKQVRLKADEPERLARWKHALELAVLEAGRPKSPVAGVAVSVQAVFYLHRPQRPEHAHPIGRVGDLDKLLRAVGDVLTGVYYSDDSQIVDWAACKVYEDQDHPEGAAIVINIVDDAQEPLTLIEG